jgi:hypothetical protein
VARHEPDRQTDAVGVKEYVTEPWGILAAGLLGGLGGAVTVALGPGILVAAPVALGIAGAVYGVRVGLGALADRGVRAAVPRPDPRLAALPVPPRGSPAATFLRRAEVAVDRLHRQTESPADPTLRSQISDVDDQAAGVLTDLRRFAGQATLIEQSRVAIDSDALRREYATLQRGLTGLRPGPLRDERERALRAVADQVDTERRLGEARDTLLARMQSAVLGLEGLVARMAELLAMHATTEGASITAGRVAELTGDLEGMRTGLAEAEELSRSTLAGGTPGAAAPPL